MTAKTQMISSTAIPLNQLRIDEKANVRKIGRGAEIDFVASIKALGIQMPLIVRKNGTGYVVADGGKRLAAAQALCKSGDLTTDAPVPCIVSNVTDAEARELSLALNLVRTDMHPVDAFRAFASLHTDKEKPLDVDALADRFGLSTKVVRQRLALGALDDVILDAWRDGAIKEDTAQAFTLCTDKKTQRKVYDKVGKVAWNGRISAEDVKEELQVNPNDLGKYLEAIGIDAYEARGGKVTRDLFGTDHIVSDEALVKLMLDEKIAATCQELLADGWGWATSDVPKNTYEFGTLQGQLKPTPDEKKKLDALTKIAEDEDNYIGAEAADDEIGQIKADILLRSYSAKQKAGAGCFVRTGNDGRIHVEYGLILPAKVKVETTETVDEETGETIRETSLGKKKTKGAKGGTKGTGTLTKALIDRLREQRETALKTALVAHPHANPFAAMLAGMIASQIRPGSWNAAPSEVKGKFDAMIAAINPKVMNAAMRKAFDPKGYFEGCGKAFCLAAITEAVNADEARKVSKGKKGEIAKFALTNVGKTLWLPKELRTPHYDGPQGKAKAKPAKKAKKK